MFFQTGGSVDEESDENWYGTEEEEPKDAEMSATPLFAMSANDRRLFDPQYLDRVGVAVQKEDLFKQVAAWETETSVADLPAADRERMAVSLRHTHLPKLCAADLVEYTTDDALTLGPNAAAKLHLELLTARRNQ